MEKAKGIRLNLSIEEDDCDDNIVMHPYRRDDEEGLRL